MIVNSEEKISRVKVSAEYPKQKVHNQSKMVFFRLINKTTYSVFIHEDIKLVQIKKVIASLVSSKVQQIKFIYKGEELVTDSQLLEISQKDIVHVVVIPERIQEDLQVWINYFGTFRKKFSVKKDAKVSQLILYLKKTRQELKNKVFLFIYLGKIANNSLTFQENKITNQTQLFLIQHKNKTSDSSVRKQRVPYIDKHQTQILEQQNLQQIDLKEVQTQTKEQLRQKLIEASNKRQLNQLGIPISDIFNLHKNVRILESQKVRQERKTQNKIKQIEFDHLLIKSNNELINFVKQDFIFAGYQNLNESQSFIKDCIRQAKLQFKKLK